LVQARLTYAKNLVPSLVARCWLTAIETCTAHAGSRSPQGRIVEYEPSARLMEIARGP
jgi:hypothetical protein